jgi:hypothetical protein
MFNGAIAELPAFSRFVSEQLEPDSRCSLEQAVQRFRDYQQQLTELRAKLAAAAESVAAGRVEPLDTDRLLEQLDDELTCAGIPY